MQTIGKRQEADRGVGSSFDLIRLTAATAVLVSHSFPITTGTNDSEFLFLASHGRTTIGEIAVDVFFVTSGFLVTGSLFRSKSLLDFGWRRSVRILPALIAVVLAAAFVIGPAFTADAGPSYFTNRETYSYLLNGVFIFRPTLPGVFGTVPVPGAVNGSLWTLFYEVVCYLCVAGAMLVRRAATPLIILAFVLLSIAALDPKLPGRLEHLVVLGGYFFAGATVFVLKDRAPFSFAVFAIAFVACVLIPILGVIPVFSQLAMAYVCIWLGFQRSFEPPGDYSYGIYLWAFPVQQMAMALFHAMPWWENISLSLPVTVAIAFLSWTFLEARAMKSKNMIARFHMRSHSDQVAEADV